MWHWLEPSWLDSGWSDCMGRLSAGSGRVHSGATHRVLAGCRAAWVRAAGWLAVGQSLALALHCLLACPLPAPSPAEDRWLPGALPLLLARCLLATAPSKVIFSTSAYPFFIPQHIVCRPLHDLLPLSIANP